MNVRNEWVKSIDHMIYVLKKIELSEDLHLFTGVESSRPTFSLLRSNM